MNYGKTRALSRTAKNFFESYNFPQKFFWRNYEKEYCPYRNAFRMPGAFDLRHFLLEVGGCERGGNAHRYRSRRRKRRHPHKGQSRRRCRRVAASVRHHGIFGKPRPPRRHSARIDRSCKSGTARRTFPVVFEYRFALSCKRYAERRRSARAQTRRRLYNGASFAAKRGNQKGGTRRRRRQCQQMGLQYSRHV